jgi:hypothetical protein
MVKFLMRPMRNLLARHALHQSIVAVRRAERMQDED